MKTSPSPLKSDVGRENTPWTVTKLRLADFRNYERAEVALGRGFNIIAGPNAHGKTNFLEAILLLSTGKLLRASKNQEAIRHMASKAIVEAELGGNGALLRVELEPGARKKATLSGSSLSRTSDLIGRLPTVLFYSGDLGLVWGEPSGRRQFLDIELSQAFPAYLRHLTVYKRALEQRNALLRASQEAPQPGELFEVWEVELSAHAGELRRYRQAFVKRLSELAMEEQSQLTGSETLELSYESKEEVTSPEAFRTLLEASRRTDVIRGSTSIGPHRDDLLIQIEGQPAKLFGSQGQQRTSVIAIKLACMTYLRETLGAWPVLLLDDIFSDLDQSRRKRLVERLERSKGQAFLTCTEAGQAGTELTEHSRIFKVDKGTILEE